MKPLKTVLLTIVIAGIVMNAVPASASRTGPIGPATADWSDQTVDLPPGGWFTGGWVGDLILRLACEIWVMENCFSQAFESFERCHNWVDQLPIEGSNAHCWNRENGYYCCEMKLTEWMIWCELTCDCACWNAGQNTCVWEAFTYEMGCSGSFDEHWNNY